MKPPTDLPQVGAWAQQKLSRLRKYLHAYMTIMRTKPWRCMYVDAFAGAGAALVRSSKTEDSSEGWLLGLEEFDAQAQQHLDAMPLRLLVT